MLSGDMTPGDHQWPVALAPDQLIRGSVLCSFCHMRFEATSVADCDVCGRLFCFRGSAPCGYRVARSQRNWACVGRPEPTDLTPDEVSTATGQELCTLQEFSDAADGPERPEDRLGTRKPSAGSLIDPQRVVYAAGKAGQRAKTLEVTNEAAVSQAAVLRRSPPTTAAAPGADARADERGPKGGGKAGAGAAPAGPS